MSSRPVFETIVTNELLGKSRVIRGVTQAEVTMKASEIKGRWALEEERLRQRQAIQGLRSLAASGTQDASVRIEEYRNLLKATLTFDDRLDWAALYDQTPFPEPNFTEMPPTKEAIEQELGVPAPSPIFELGWRKRKSRRLELEAEAVSLLQDRMAKFEERLAEFERRVAEERVQFQQSQDRKNAEVGRFKAAFERGVAEEVERYTILVLDRSLYPEGFAKEFAVQYVPDSQTLIVNYQLPSPNDVPRVVQHRFVQSRKAIESVEMKQKEFDTFYEMIIFQITLRTIHEVFEADYPSHFQVVVFNGWVSGVNRATGQDFTSCLISCQASREQFVDLRLSRVDPKESVRALKGLVAGPLAQLAPVHPIMQIAREDRRFVEAREVLTNLDPSLNLAEMPWEDFEHLVRELFAKIFARDGGEVQVTQASRDGGVDAVAFDPDPIRGGKFVIQAKRYNGVVPVSAVRDLYGTMINEGAVKGILVTTSYYGHDSREFAKDKPITLLDGPNLIYLLHEQGSNVRIELSRGRGS